jgi:hypothetical protein
LVLVVGNPIKGDPVQRGVAIAVVREAEFVDSYYRDLV